MYKPDTILRLKDPRTVDEDEPFAYDRVRVVGQSPVQHADISSEWVGGNGQGVIIEPLSGFGSNLDEPLGRLQELYEVESLPEAVVITGDQVKVVKPEDLPPSPEDIFADATAAAGQDSRRVKPVKEKPSPLVATEPDPEEVAKQEAVKREALRRAGLADDSEDADES